MVIDANSGMRADPEAGVQASVLRGQCTKVVGHRKRGSHLSTLRSASFDAVLDLAKVTHQEFPYYAFPVLARQSGYAYYDEVLLGIPGDV